MERPAENTRLAPHGRGAQVGGLSMASLLTLLDLTLHFGGPAIMEKVNFQLEPGERICLVGRNGVGKTTLMGVIDRKSTRLNSSHLGTSYAAFCLQISTFWENGQGAPVCAQQRWRRRCGGQWS